MPAKSKSQQRLFQMALAVRHGELDRSKVYKSVLDIVDSDMTDEQIKHFTILKESFFNGYEIKFYNSVIKKYNLDIDKIKKCLNNVDDIDLLYNNDTLLLHIDFNSWNKYLAKIKDVFSILKTNNIPNDALLRFAESGEHEEIYQEVEKVISECECNFSTPMNTLGMGNVNIDGGPDLVLVPTQRIKKLKRKRKMKGIKEYIKESLDYVNEKDLINKFYRANIAKENQNEKIGDVVEISRKHYSMHDKAFVFGKPDKYSDWTHVMNIKLEDIKSNSAFQNYINKLNKEDEFFHYFINKSDAEKCATKAKIDYEKQKYTLESLLADIKSYKPLTDLGYDYKISEVYQNKARSIKTRCIYVSHTWTINVEDNKIIMHNAGWRKYFVANVQSIYKVLTASGGSSETQRIRYSYDYENE